MGRAIAIDLVARRPDRLDAVSGAGGFGSASSWAAGSDWTATDRRPWRTIGRSLTSAPDIVLAARAPDVVDAVAIDDAGRVVTTWSVDGRWAHESGGWTVLGSGFSPGGSLAIAASGAERLVVVGIRGRDAFATVWADGSWSHLAPDGDFGAAVGWRPIGRGFSPGTQLSATATPGRVDVAAIDRSGVVRTTAWIEGGGWRHGGGAWEPLSESGFLPGAPVGITASIVDGRRVVDVVATPVPHQSPLARRSVDDVWEHWQSLGSQLLWAQTPVVVRSRRPGVVDAFAVGSDHTLLTAWRTGRTWSDWQSLGGRFPIGRPGVASRRPDVLDVIVADHDDAWHAWWQEGVGWSTARSGWRRLGTVRPLS